MMAEIHPQRQHHHRAVALPERDAGDGAHRMGGRRRGCATLQRWLVGLLLSLMALPLVAQNLEFTGTVNAPQYTFTLLRGFDHSGDNKILLDSYRVNNTVTKSTRRNFCSFLTYIYPNGRHYVSLQTSQWEIDSKTVANTPPLTFTMGNFELVNESYSGVNADTSGGGDEDTVCRLYYTGSEDVGQLTQTIYGILSQTLVPAAYVSEDLDDDDNREINQTITVNFVGPRFVSAQQYTFNANARTGSQFMGNLEFDFSHVHPGYGGTFTNNTYFAFEPLRTGVTCNAETTNEVVCNAYDRTVSGANGQTWRINNVPGDTTDRGTGYLHYRNSNVPINNANTLIADTAYSFTVTGYAGGNSGSKTSAVVVVNAQDIQFDSEQQYTFTVRVNDIASDCRNTSGGCGVLVGTIQALDTAGDNTVIRYTFTGGTGLLGVNALRLGYVEDSASTFRIVNRFVASTSGTQAVAGFLYFIGDSRDTYGVDITASGGDNSAGTERTIGSDKFLVTVRDLVFSPDNYNFALNLGFSAPGGIVLGTVTAVEPSNQAISYTTERADFTIDADGVMQYVGDGITEAGTIALPITAKVSGPLSGEERADNAIVNINVINDRSPEFVTDAYTFNLVQNVSGSGSPIILGTVEAIDLNRDIVSYTIAAGGFSVGVTDGIVSYIGDGIISAPGLYTIEVTASDAAPNFAAQTVAINVLGVEFTQTTDYVVTIIGGQALVADYVFTLSQGANGRSMAIAFGAIAATDPGGQSVTYSIDQVSIDAGFVIGVLDGAFSYGGVATVFSSVQLYPVYVTAETDNERRSGVGLIIIDVQNDRSPEFLQNRYNFTLRSNTSGILSALAVGTVSSIDPNLETPFYVISRGNDAGLFSIGSVSGVLSYIGSGQAAETDLPELVISAFDEVFNITEAAVIVNIVGVLFERSSYTFSLDRGVDGSQTAVLFGTVTASDSASRSFSYATNRNDFAIDAEGALYYVGTGAFNVTGLEAIAQTGDEIARVLIVIELSNDASPEFVNTESYSFTIVAHVNGSSTPPGVVVGTVTATDRNQDELEYSTAFAGFAVGATSGIVYYTGSGLDDGEMASIPVTARERNGANAAQASVMVEAVGLRFESPSGYTFAFEHGSGNRIVGTIIASNATPNQPFNYLVEGDRQDFTIDEDSENRGVLRYNLDTNGLPDAVAVTIIVIASNPPAYQYKQVVVTVELQNNYAPVFDRAGGYTFTLPANSPGNQTPVLLGTVSASDQNEDAVGYSLQPGSDSSRFSIAASSGAIYYIGETGAAIFESLSVTVSAADASGNSNVATVSFTVIGVAFSMSSYTFTLTKGQAGGSIPIGTVTAEPSVGGDNVTYKFASLRNRFFIYIDNQSNGIIQYIGTGETNDVMLTVFATDQFSVATAAVLIVVQNDASPMFAGATPSFVGAASSSCTGATPPLLFCFDAGKNGAFMIGVVAATDRNGDQPTYAISVTPNSGSDRFSIASSNGQISYIGSGESVGASYTLNIVASDGVNSSMIAAVVVEAVELRFAEGQTTTFTLSKGQSGPLRLGAISATDPYGDPIAYTVISETSFSIGAADGEFYYTGNGEMQVATLTATVRATAQNRSKTTGVTVVVQNDRAPMFVGAPYLFPLDANRSGALSAFPVGTVSATDGNQDTLLYAIGAGTDQFTIDTNSGVIHYRGSGAASGASFALTVTANDGANNTAAAQVTILVDRVTIDRNTSMVTMTLAQVARNIAVDTVNVLGSRFGAVPHVTISGVPANEAAWQRISRWAQLSHWQSSGDWDGVERAFDPMPDLKQQWQQFRGGIIKDSSFLLPLGANGNGGNGGNGAAIGSNWTLWGQGRYSGYDRESSGVKVSGNVLSGYLGADYMLEGVVFADDRMLIGVALSHSINKGQADPLADGERIDIDSTMNNIAPYVQWSLGNGRELWGAFGFGFGSAKLTDSVALNVETDISMQSLSGGFKQTLATIGDYTANSADLSLKADAFIVSTSSDAAGTGTQSIDATSADSYRLRLAMMDHRRWPLAGAAYDGGWELGGRLDGGDAAEGFGLDFGVNFGYTDMALGLTVHSQGRWLLAHSDEYSEWGIDMMVRLRPQWLGRGLSLAFEPGWGQAAADVDNLWRNEMPTTTTASATASGGFAPDRTRLSLSYGLHYYRVLLQPFMEMGLETDDVTQLKLGLKLSTSALDLEFVGDQTQRIGVNSRIEW